MPDDYRATPNVFAVTPFDQLTLGSHETTTATQRGTTASVSVHGSIAGSPYRSQATGCSILRKVKITF